MNIVLSNLLLITNLLFVYLLKRVQFDAFDLTTLLTDFQTSITNINSADTVLLNYKRVYQIIHYNLLNGTLLTSDSIILLSLANLCPLYYGEPVFLARSLISHNGVRYDLVDCNGSTYRTQEKDINVRNKIELYPNPTANKLFVKDVTELTPYKIMNQLGQVAMTGTTNDRQVINIQSLPKGIYILNVDGYSASTFVKI